MIVLQVAWAALNAGLGAVNVQRIAAGMNGAAQVLLGVNVLAIVVAVATAIYLAKQEGGDE